MILRNSYIFYVISLYIYYVLYSSVQQCTALYRYSVRYITVPYTINSTSTSTIHVHFNMYSTVRLRLHCCRRSRSRTVMYSLTVCGAVDAAVDSCMSSPEALVAVKLAQLL